MPCCAHKVEKLCYHMISTKKNQVLYITKVCALHSGQHCVAICSSTAGSEWCTCHITTKKDTSLKTTSYIIAEE